MSRTTISPLTYRRTTLSPQNDLAPKVYIVLVNWNAWGHTIECLETIYRSDYSNYQVIIVDNASADDSLDRITDWAQGNLCAWSNAPEPMRPYSFPPIGKQIPIVTYSRHQAEAGGDPTSEEAAYAELPVGIAHPLILLHSGSNAGFGGGNNVALSFISRRGDGDYIWLLNNDTAIEPDTLSAMVKTARAVPGIVGAVVRYYSRPEKVQAYGGGYVSHLTGSARLVSKRKGKPLNFIFGASFMMDRATLDQLGLFDENIFLYFEEVEYCIRARQRGILMGFSHANVYHKVGASSGNRYFQWKHIYRNRVYTMLKHFGVGPWVVFTSLNWLTNVVSPFVDADKRRASREAFSHLFESLSQRRHSSRAAHQAKE